MARIIGIDYGHRRIGLAMSDPSETIASPLHTYTKTTDDDALTHILSLVKEHKVITIVLGLPKNMDGTEGESARLVRDFGDKLMQSGIELVLRDERLSSVTANKALDEGGVHWSKRKNVVDVMAAQIILQGYLDIKNRI